MLKLKDKVAVITGAGNGIGRESAYLFAREGAAIVVVDIDQTAGLETARQITLAGGRAMFVEADVSQREDCRHMIEHAEQCYGKLNILFNNAGVMRDDDSDAVDTPDEAWEHTLNVNLRSVFYGCKFGIPALRQAGGGSIINTASFVALMGAATPQIAYTASKGAVLALTRELAVVHAREHIRVNALCPGPLQTDLLMSYLDTDEKKSRRLVHIPMGRFGHASEIAKAALFLASDDSSYMTGAQLVVDGGITAAYVTPAEG